MSEPSPEKLPDRIARMGRPGLIKLLGRLECSFTLDFTPEFLDSITLQRLRHIVAAAAYHATNGEYVSDRKHQVAATRS